MMGVAVKGIGLQHTESAEAHSKLMVAILIELRHDIKGCFNLDSLASIVTA